MILSKTLESITVGIVYSFPLISIAGFFFNSLSFVIFSQKKFQKTSFSIYFRFLIISDSLSLLLPINRMLEWNFLMFISNYSDFFCKLRAFYSYAIRPISGWTTVVIGLDRMIDIMYPTRFLFRKQVKFQIITCLSILFFDFMFYIPVLFFRLNRTPYFDTQTNKTSELIICENKSIPVFWMDLFQSALVPFILMLTSTSLILRCVFKSRHLRQRARRRKDLKYAVTSISLNIIFLLLNSPFVFYNLISTYISINYAVDEFLFILCLTMLYLNFLSVFFINISANSIFKEEFYKLLSKNGSNNTNDNKKSTFINNELVLKLK